MQVFTLELCLLLLIYFEAPGYKNSDGDVKTVSEGLDQHPGFGAALFVCFVTDTVAALYNTEWKEVAALLVWACQASVLGVIIYPPRYEEQHFIFAAGFFFSSYAITLLRWWEDKIDDFVLGVSTVAFVMLVVAFYYWPSIVGILEIVYLYVMLASWSCVKKKNVSENLTSPLWV
jgi:hypothetical protein